MLLAEYQQFIDYFVVHIVLNLRLETYVPCTCKSWSVLAIPGFVPRDAVLLAARDDPGGLV